MVEFDSDRKKQSDFHSAFRSETRKVNGKKGYFAFAELNDIACWIVTEAIDDDAEMKSAKIVADQLFEDFMKGPTLSRRKLRHYLSRAHESLKAESKNIRLKASLIMVVSDYANYVWIVSGNNRLYLFHEGKYNFRSKDQTVGQNLVDAGEIDDRELNNHPNRNNLLNYLGRTATFEPFISQKYRLCDGDALLLCNPGFWEKMSGAEMQIELEKSDTSSNWVERLEEKYLSKAGDNYENYVMAAIYANKVVPENPVNHRMNAVKIATFLILSGAVATASWFGMNHIKDANRLRQVRENTILKEQALRQGIIDNELKGDQLLTIENYQEAVAKYQASLNFIHAFTKNIMTKNYQAKEDRLKKKQASTLLIIAGDRLASSGDYKGASEKYLCASQIATNIRFDKSGLKTRLTKYQNLTSFITYENCGDVAAQKEDFDTALAQYCQAREVAVKYQYKDLLDALDSKIDATRVQRRKAQEQQKPQIAQYRYERSRTVRWRQMKLAHKKQNNQTKEQTEDANYQAVQEPDQVGTDDKNTNSEHKYTKNQNRKSFWNRFDGD